jgi:hypothetical protein
MCLALSVAARSVVALYRPVLEPMGLTHAQYLVMLALGERSPRSVEDLSAALALDPGTFTATQSGSRPPAWSPADATGQTIALSP